MIRKIIVQQPPNDEMGSMINKLLAVLFQLEKVQSEDSVIIDITNIRFAHPILFLPISSLIAKLRLQNYNVAILGQTSYLETILFPEGFDATNREDWNESIDYYRDRTYLPICQIPAGISDTSIRENLLTVFETIMRQQLNLSGQLLTAVSYIIAEAMDNIVDHASVQNGWIMVQNYPTKHFLDTCILDNGIGIHGSYINHMMTEIESDASALQQAINGQSTKQIAETRGYGINTSRRMLVDGIKGKYFLFSGAAFYIYTGEFEQIIPLDQSYKWEGTMLALRIPRDIPPEFNYIDYLE